jgi:hypothetical protein
MGQEYSASRYDTIPEESVSAVCLKEYEAFMDALMASSQANDESADHVLELFARAEMFSEKSYEFKGGKKIHTAWVKLQKAFKAVTSLDLQIAYVGEGLRGSDLFSETVWFIGNNYIRNPAALAFEKDHKVQVNEQWFMDAG